MNSMKSILKYLEHSSMDKLVNISLPTTSIEELISSDFSAGRLTKLIKLALETDSDNNWPNRAQRVFVLLSLYYSFETQRDSHHDSLKAALAKIKSLSGRPFSVIGTKCELASRTASALFAFGRNSPSTPQLLEMLELSHNLLGFLLSECRQKDNPKHAMRFHGIRAVCRLMFAVQIGNSHSEEQQYAMFQAAVRSFEKSFELGNKGESAVTYFLDSLMHLFEFDQSEHTLDKVDQIINELSDKEKNNRGVLFFWGKYYFAKSFLNHEQSEFLFKALDKLDRSLDFKQIHSIDDQIVRLIRGQVLVRLAIFFKNNNQQQKDCLAHLNNGIKDLDFSFKKAPEKYGNQVSLPSALQSRSEIKLKQKKYDEAKEDLLYILNTPELRNIDLTITSRSEIKLMIIDLLEAFDQQDNRSIKDLLPHILEHPLCTNEGSFFVGLAAKKIFLNTSNSDDPSLLKKVVEMLNSVDLEVHNDPSTQQMHFSILGSLQTMLSIWDYSFLEDAIDSYIEALNLPVLPPPELLTSYGESSLRLAKHFYKDEKKVERSAELFEEASDAFINAIQQVENNPDSVSEDFNLVVTYSKAGEAKLRLCMLTGSETDARIAIKNFQKANELGNNTPQLFGLIGDCYYQIYKSTRSKPLLKNVLYYKNLAREAGGHGRENLSLSAKINFLLWEDSAKIDDLANSIEMAAKAYEESPAWPWPPFQLLEIANHAGMDSFIAALEYVQKNNPHYRLVKIALTDTLDSLIEMGCRLVISNDEFGRKILGGRQKVYVLDDPHRLLSESYVFKKTFEKNALRDKRVILDFSNYLSEKNICGLRFPRPVALIPHTNKGRVIYVMKRSKGYHLGRNVIRANKEGKEPPLKEFKRVLEYLAAYHSWGAVKSRVSVANLVLFARSYIKNSMSIKHDILPKACVTFLEKIDDIPKFLKKDAHPENWLIDRFGNICMIDFESSKPLPALFEVAQLLEDYPLLAANQENWTRRCNMCRHYLNYFEKFFGLSIAIEDSEMEALYAIFAILRCGFGLTYCNRKNKTTLSSSSLKSNQERIIHYMNLLNWFVKNYPKKGIGDFAMEVKNETA